MTRFDLFINGKIKYKQYIVRIFDAYLSLAFEYLTSIIKNVSSNDAHRTNKQEVYIFLLLSIKAFILFLFLFLFFLFVA
jgi:hypothetical protein